MMLGHTVEALFIGHIVDQENSHGAAIVGGSDCSETFLSSSVPYLQLDSLAVEVNGPDLKVDADGGDETRGKAVFGKA